MTYLINLMRIGLYFLYVIEGTILIILNFLISITIFTNRRFREQKEYLILAGNILFDLLFGIAYFSTGLSRLIFFFTYKNSTTLKYPKLKIIKIKNRLLKKLENP